MLPIRQFNQQGLMNSNASFSSSTTTPGGEWTGRPQEQEIFNAMYSSNSKSLPGSPSLDTFLDSAQLQQLDNLARCEKQFCRGTTPSNESIAAQWLNDFSNVSEHRLTHFIQSHSNLVLYLPDYPYPVFVFNLGYLNNICQQVSVLESRRMLSLALPHLEIGTLLNSEVVVTDLPFANSATYPTLYLDIPLPSSYNGHFKKYVPSPETLPTLKTLRESYAFQRSVPLTLDIERAFKLAQAVPYFFGSKRSNLATQVLRECYSVEPHSIYVYCMIYICLFGYTFQPNGKEVSALDLIIRQALFECSTIDAIVLLRASIKLLEFPEGAKGNWVKVSAREFNAVKMKILEYIDDKFTRMFYKLFNSPESDLLNYTGFLLIANLIRSSRLVVDDENQVLRALRQYLIINADVIIAEKSKMTVPEQMAERIQQIPVTREIYSQKKQIPKKQIEVFQERYGRIFFRISRYSQLVEDAICYMIAGIRWHSFGDNALSMLQYLYEDLNHVGVITEFSFDTFCYMVESHRDPTTMLNRTIKQVSNGKGGNRNISQNMLTFKSTAGNGVMYPREIMLSYNCFDNRHYFQTFHLSSVGKGVRLNDLSNYARYHALRMKENRVINRFLTFDMKIFQSFIRDVDAIQTNKFDRILIKAHNSHDESLATSYNLITRHNNLLANCENKYRNGYVHDCVMPYNFNHLIQILKKQVFAMQHPQFINKLNKDIEIAERKAKRLARQQARRGSIASSSSSTESNHHNYNTGLNNGTGMDFQGQGQVEISSLSVAVAPTPNILPMMANVFNCSNNQTSRILAAHNRTMMMSQSNQGCSSSGYNTPSVTNQNSKQGIKRTRESKEFQFVFEDGINSNRAGRAKKKKESIQGQNLTLEQQIRENADLLSLSGASNIERTVELNVQQAPPSNFQIPTTTFRPKHFVNFLVYKAADEFHCSSPNVGPPEVVLDEINLPLYICRPSHISPSRFLEMMDISSILKVSMRQFCDILNGDEVLVGFKDSIKVRGVPQRDLNDPTLHFIDETQRDPEDIDWESFNVDAFCDRVAEEEMKKQQQNQEVYMHQVMMKQFEMMHQQPANMLEDEGSVFDLLISSPVGANMMLQNSMISGNVEEMFNSFLDPIVEEMNELEGAGQCDLFKYDEFQPHP